VNATDSKPGSSPPRALFLISDTGGGHRAAAVVVGEALRAAAPGATTAIEDALVRCAAWPSNRAPAMYAWAMRKARWIWALSFVVLNGPRRARFFAKLNYPTIGRKLERLIRDHRPNVVVSTHPLLTHVAERATRRAAPGAPFVVVVTDLVTGHASWYLPEADRVLLPTRAALERALKCGVSKDRAVLTGQPVHPKAVEATTRRDALRARYGWNEPVVLLVGGGDGMGNLGARVRALAQARVKARLVVVCGRNEALRRELSGTAWPIPVEVTGFVDDLHERNAAADVLVTKGGPGSIAEGCVAGLPIVVYDFIPGQEAGNVRLVEESGAGVYVPNPSDLPAAVDRYLSDPAHRAETSRRARSLAIPDSAARAAREILATLAARRA
jgi:1,2-diacylglycerol 3-beta-galactosyltransferase